MKRDQIQLPSSSRADDQPVPRTAPLEACSQEDVNALIAALYVSSIEIYEVDLEQDTIHAIIQSRHRNIQELTPGCFSDVVRLLAVRCVHPEDRDSFQRFFDIKAIRHRLEWNNTSPHEYRILYGDTGFLWSSDRVLPMGDASAGKALLIAQDVTIARSIEEDRRGLERRYTALFRQSYDAVTEINLETGKYTRSSHHASAAHFSHQQSYSELLELTLRAIHPDDQHILAASRSLESLRRSFESDGKAACQYRMMLNGEYLWVESHVVFIYEDEIRWAFLLARDVTEEKRIEEQRHHQVQRLNLALRDTYTEIYEFDLEHDTSTMLFANSERLLPVGVGTCSQTETIINQAIHPDDRERVRKSLLGSYLREAFASGQSEVTEEFRRLGRDGAYYWVSAAIVPIRDCEAISSKAVLVIKDITDRREREQRQRVSEQYDRALRTIYDELYELNISQDSYRIVYHTSIQYVTPPAEGKLSRTLGNVGETMVHPGDRERFFAFFEIEAIRAQFASGKEYCFGEFRKLCHDGQFRWAALTLFPVSIAQGDEIYLVFIMDIDARRHADEIAQQNAFLERQRIADERYRIIMEQTNTLIFEWCPENRTRFTSPKLARRYAGKYDERALFRIWTEDEVIHRDDQPLFKRFLERSAEEPHQEMTVRFLRRDGEFVWCKVTLSCLHDPKSETHRYIGTFNDVDAATRSEHALRYKAEYDTLTGIYNMQTFNTRASELIRTCPERQYYIIRMDVDRFKIVNDLYGMEEGDLLLRSIAQMLSERMTAYTVCGRLGGDIFCACVDFTRERTIALVLEMAERLAKYPLPSRIVLSFGMCRVDSVETPINVLCDWANLALKTIKGNVLVSHAFYDENLRKSILEEKRIESEMHNALAQDQFCIYLQPKVHIPTSRIIGSEGLVRWNHPVDGTISPDNFIPLFEKNGFIIRLDEYIWEQACIVLRRWIDLGYEALPISVNVSRMHIHDVRLCEKLIGLVARYHLPPRLLELELTESVFLDSENQLFDSIRKLQKAGFTFSLDDFGAGYSSLNVLKSVPFETIKIDRGFLNEVGATERGKIIIRHTIALAADMNMQVVAEGVETREQAAFLYESRCSFAQGFFYSRPVPVAVFEGLAFNNAGILSGVPVFPFFPE